MKIDNKRVGKVIVAVALIALIASISLGYIQLYPKRQVRFMIASSGALDHIVITPGESSAAEVLSGTTQDFNATGFDENGSIVTVDAVWSVIGSSEIGMIDNTTGLFAALSAGSVSVMVIDGNVSETATVNVISATPSNVSVTASPAELDADGDSTSQIIATLLDAQGNPVANHTLDFSISSGSGNITVTDSLTNATGEASAEYTAAAFAGNVVIAVEDTTMPGLVGNVSISLTGGYPIQLTSGWNLISIPQTPS